MVSCVLQAQEDEARTAAHPGRRRCQTCLLSRVGRGWVCYAERALVKCDGRQGGEGTACYEYNRACSRCLPRARDGAARAGIIGPGSPESIASWCHVTCLRINERTGGPSRGEWMSTRRNTGSCTAVTLESSARCTVCGPAIVARSYRVFACGSPDLHTRLVAERRQASLRMKEELERSS